MSCSLLVFFFFFIILVVVDCRPTIDDLGTLLRERSNDPALFARLEQIMGNDFGANDGRLFNLQRLG